MNKCYKKSVAKSYFMYASHLFVNHKCSVFDESSLVIFRMMASCVVQIIDNKQQ